MDSKEIRNSFFKFFESKNHKIVPSAPMVIKNDPTLMFTNAGMNQFKDIFLGNLAPKYKRVANTQKCLRVSGKHNDLEEVGHDTYHHTMFEMLGNWSFGDYFKEEAINWAWEYLTQVLKIDKSRLYATYFQGNPEENLTPDFEACELWKKHLPTERIIAGSKKDNFWEMGDTGPCGPCSEIHIDLRNDEERNKIPGYKLVNQGNPEVIEIWNLVFIQYNRNADGSLTQLPDKHIDTGMGFERLCRIVQNKNSNYDTDLFIPIIKEIEKISNKQYKTVEKIDVAMRVVADHIRAIAFAIADGQLPSNNKAGYVIRRILRRAIRYGYTYLDMKEPFMYKLIPTLTTIMGEQFPELIKQQNLIENVIHEEELSFLKTLAFGINKFEAYINSGKKIIDGNFAFELFDTYGFPIDLTQLMAKEKSLEVDMNEFEKLMNQQRERSKTASEIIADDWIIVNEINNSASEFVGYDYLEYESLVVKYRKITQKNKTYYQLVLNKTPFYAEAGGQVGDSGILIFSDEKIPVINTLKENELIIHLTEKLPTKIKVPCKAIVDKYKRLSTQKNHTATHLLHYALRTILGNHVEQKGSLVAPDRLRFDFSHFSKLSQEEIDKIENFVNEIIEQNINLEEYRNIPYQEALNLGAIALFGEKYGEEVRAIKFGNSIELCGGTHVKNTSEIKFFKIINESAIAAGIRRIEAITAHHAINYLKEKEKELEKIKSLLKNPRDIVKSIEKLIDEVNTLNKKIESLKSEKVNYLMKNLESKIQIINNLNCIIERLDEDPEILKDLTFKLKAKYEEIIICLIGKNESKVSLIIAISEKYVKDKNINAAEIIKIVSKDINGGGGGQAHFASAGGTNVSAIDNTIEKIKNILSNIA